jgi:hypothetical protein
VLALRLWALLTGSAHATATATYVVLLRGLTHALQQTTAPERAVLWVRALVPLAAPDRVRRDELSALLGWMLVAAAATATADAHTDHDHDDEDKDKDAAAACHQWHADMVRAQAQLLAAVVRGCMGDAADAPLDAVAAWQVAQGTALRRLLNTHTR